MKEQSLEAIQEAFFNYVGRKFTEEELELSIPVLEWKLRQMKTVSDWTSKLDFVEPATVSSLLAFEGTKTDD